MDFVSVLRRSVVLKYITVLLLSFDITDNNICFRPIWMYFVCLKTAVITIEKKTRKSNNFKTLHDVYSQSKEFDYSRENFYFLSFRTNIDIIRLNNFNTAANKSKWLPVCTAQSMEVFQHCFIILDCFIY